MAANRIMVVDGSGVARELITRNLAGTLHDTQITTSASGREALEKLTEESYTLIITAPVLSDMEGVDLCRSIRQSHSQRHIPIIVISSDIDRPLLKETFAAGVTDYFDKSRGYPAFATFIKSFCQRNTGLVGRVLYIEDSRTAAMLTRRVLERHGLQLTHVTSAEQALQRLEGMRKGEECYDIVITDFHLEEAMTGGDLLHAIRTRLHYSRQELPVLLMTGHDDQQIQLDSLYAGANDFVQKPVVEEVLMVRVHSMLLIRQMHDALLG